MPEDNLSWGLLDQSQADKDKERLTIVLITGDGDFVHNIKQLRSRGCRVIVISGQSNPRLKEVASATWPLDALIPKPSSKGSVLKEMSDYILNEHSRDSGIVYCLSKKVSD